MYTVFRDAPRLLIKLYFFFKNLSTPFLQSSVCRAIALISTPACNAASNDIESMLYNSRLGKHYRRSRFRRQLRHISFDLRGKPIVAKYTMHQSQAHAPAPRKPFRL